MASLLERAQTAWGVFRGAPAAAEKPLPTTHEEWKALMVSWEAWYAQAPYTAAESSALNLFRAVRDNGDLIVETKRSTREVQFVIDVDRKLLFQDLVIEVIPTGKDGKVTPEDEAYLEAAVAVWQRSHGEEQAAEWGLKLCTRGTHYLAPVLHSTGLGARKAYIVSYDPMLVHTVWHHSGIPLMVGASISMPYYDKPTMNPTGELTQNQVLNSYVRTLGPRSITRQVQDAEGDTIDQITREGMWVTTYKNGEEVEEESGGFPELAGAIPLVQMKFQPSGQLGYGLWACHGLTLGLSAIDSMSTMTQAAGIRYAAPTMVMTGADLDTQGAGEVQRFGTTLHGLPADAQVYNLEAKMSGSEMLLKDAQDRRASLRSTFPEFLFVGVAADSSGTALSYRAAQLVSKIEEIRSRIYPALARVLEMAVSMDTEQQYTPDTRRLKITAGPVLPVDVAALIESLSKVDALSAIQKVDVVRQLQRVGLVPVDADAQTYADELVAPVEPEQELPTD